MSTKKLDRKETIEQLGLPEDSSWTYINAHCAELWRKNIATSLGLPETASWAEITSCNTR